MAESHDSLAATFMNITGAEPASALQYLELTNWTLEEAVNLYMESGHGGGGGAMSSSAHPPAAPMATAYGDDDIRAPDPSKRQRLVGSRFDSVPLRRLHDQYRDFAAESIAAINAASEDSSAIASSFGPSSGSERSRDLSGLFQPPVSIMFQGTYAEARQHAKSEGKWLLVNIQDDIVFASHMLNRDTWADDVVQNLVASGFVFWQNYWASEHGKKFCTLYQIDRETLPIVAIIHPLTGEILQQWTGFMEPQDMTEKLSDFCCMNTLEQRTQQQPSAREASPPPSTASVDIQDASEEDQLAAAIAASMENNGQVADVTYATQEEEETKQDGDEEVVVEMPPEPADGTPDVTRVQIRAPDGSRLTRRFLKSDPMAMLWTFVREQIPEARSRAFELRTAFPPAMLAFSETDSIADRKLENASLMLKWA